MKKTVIQIRQTTTGLMESCNQFLTVFDRNEFRLVVIFLKGKASDDITAKIPADEVIYLDSKSSWVTQLGPVVLFRLYRYLKSENPQIILAHRYQSVFFTGLISLFYKVPTKFAVFHGNGQIDRSGRRAFTNFLLKKEFYFVGISNVVRDDLLSSRAGLIADNVFSTPNAIDIEAQKKSMLVHDEASSVLGTQGFEFVIGTIGRLSPIKNQKFLIEAFAEVSHKMPEAGLVIVGGGRLQSEFQELAERLQIGSKVILTGEVKNAANLISAMDLFVMTSTDEGFGRVLLEAMVARCPIVATKIPAFVEVLKGSGSLVDLGNTEMLSNALYNHYKMTLDAREDVLERQDEVLNSEYSLPAFTTRLKKILESFQQ